MNKLFLSLVTGSIAGIIDIVPMLMKKLSKKSIISAFLHYFLLAFVIIFIDLPKIPWWLSGGLIALLLSLPIMIIVSDNDKKALPVMVIMALFLGSLIGFAAHNFGTTAPNDQAIDSIGEIASLLKMLADLWDQNIIKKNLPAIAANMSPDFRQIDKHGNVYDKETFLRNIVSPDLTIYPYTVEDFNIRVYGTCALLHGTTAMHGTYQGRPFSSRYRYIDTYTLIDGQWKVCQVQITALDE